MDLIYNFILYLPIKDVFTMCCLNKETYNFLDNKHLWNQKTNGIFKKTFTINDYIKNVQLIYHTVINKVFELNINKYFLYTILPKKFNDYIYSYKIPDCLINLRHRPDHIVMFFWGSKLNKYLTIYMEQDDVVCLLKNIFIHDMYAKLYTYDTFNERIYYNLF